MIRQHHYKLVLSLEVLDDSRKWQRIREIGMTGGTPSIMKRRAKVFVDNFSKYIKAHWKQKTI